MRTHRRAEIRNDMKSRILIITGFIILFGVILGCNQMTKPMRKSSVDLKVTATELAMEFDKDPKSANAKYYGKTLAITGDIDGKMAMTVIFKTPREYRHAVQCFFNEKDRGSLRQIKIGTEVTVIGYCKGVQQSGGVAVGDCALY